MGTQITDRKIPFSLLEEESGGVAESRDVLDAAGRASGGDAHAPSVCRLLSTAIITLAAPNYVPNDAVHGHTRPSSQHRARLVHYV